MISSKELLNDIVNMVRAFNHDYQQMGNYRDWLFWNDYKISIRNLCKDATREERQTIFDKVGEAHDIGIAPYLQYGISKVWDESPELQKNVRFLISLYDEE